MSAVTAMKSARLQIDVETAYRRLEEITKERGPDDTRHFDRLLERLGLKWNPEVIAAGVVAYPVKTPIYLVPFPDAVPTLLRQRCRIQARRRVEGSRSEAVAETDPAGIGTYLPRCHRLRGDRIRETHYAHAIQDTRETRQHQA